MRPRRRSAGFTLVEVLVALVLLSVCALALARTLVAAQRTQETSERWMQAVQLAAEGMEELRLAGTVSAAGGGSAFQRSGRVVPLDPTVGLERLEVIVSWNEGVPRTFQLVTLARH